MRSDDGQKEHVVGICFFFSDVIRVGIIGAIGVLLHALMH
jgi:hypothetical protein